MSNASIIQWPVFVILTLRWKFSHKNFLLKIPTTNFCIEILYFKFKFDITIPKFPIENLDQKFPYQNSDEKFPIENSYNQNSLLKILIKIFNWKFWLKIFL